MVKSFIFGMLFSFGLFGMESPPMSSEFLNDVKLFPSKAELALQKKPTRNQALDWAEKCYNKNVYLYYVPSLPVCGNIPEYYQGTHQYAPRLHALASKFYFAAAQTEDGTWEDVFNGLYYLAWSYFPEKEQ